MIVDLREFIRWKILRENTFSLPTLLDREFLKKKTSKKP